MPNSPIGYVLEAQHFVFTLSIGVAPDVTPMLSSRSLFFAHYLFSMLIFLPLDIIFVDNYKKNLNFVRYEVGEIWPGISVSEDVGAKSSSERVGDVAHLRKW